MTRLSELIRGESKHSLSMPRWLERLAAVGIVTANPEIARRQRITNIGAFVAGGTTLAHLVINAVHDPGGLVVVHIFNAAFAVLALLTPTLHRYGENAAAVGLASKEQARAGDYRPVALAWPFAPIASLRLGSLAASSVDVGCSSNDPLFVSIAPAPSPALGAASPTSA
jgi:MASE7